MLCIHPPNTKFINLAIIGEKEVKGEVLVRFKLATLHGDVDQILDEKAPMAMEYF